ncbi:serine/threonine-protein kinase [Streptomyces sp. NBC_01451]|uniref:serine/threonine-protein kinase n=1 Tax=Streptomyces sp. NBC_01451 TaxID=2903872 RepID=UPI002E357E84|nr:serine/threonine-protein kinase [Streptomyces sp. NBC_01451]
MADLHVIGGRYEIQGQLGAGGMGRVYEARDLRLDRRVAVKVLPTGLGASAPQDRFLREARALARISHPNAVAIHDIDVHDDAPYLVMELLEGVDLARLLALRGALPPDLVRSVASGMCSGLAAVHNAGMLHRDVKPSNVHLTREGRVVLQDFGIAHLLDSAQTHLTSTGAVIGTPVYMAPEAIRGDRAGPHSDLYALGTCMYEMLTGRRAFDGDSPMTIIYRAVYEEAPSLRDLPGVPDDLADLAGRLMAKDPGLRPSASEVRELLRCPANATELVAEAATGELRERAVRDFVPDGLPTTATLLLFRRSELREALGEGQRAARGRTSSPPPSEPGVHSSPDGALALSSGTLSQIRLGISPEVAEARQREAVNLVLRGSLEEAVELLTTVAEVCRVSLGATHPTTLTCHYWQGVCLARLGAGGEAVAKFAEVTAAASPVRTGEGL